MEKNSRFNGLGRFDLQCDECMSTAIFLDFHDGGEYCCVDDVIDELKRRIDVTYTLPDQQLALKQFLAFVEGRRWDYQ